MQIVHHSGNQPSDRGQQGGGGQSTGPNQGQPNQGQPQGQQGRRETEEEATRVLRGAAFVDGAPTTIVPSNAATQARSRPPADDYFDYSAPVRERSIWPWLLVSVVLPP